MAEIVWTAEAADGIELIEAYISKFDPVAARRLVARLIEVAASLAEFPERGRPAGNGKREVPIVPPYLIRYEVRGETVYIVSIRHGRQTPSP